MPDVGSYLQNNSDNVNLRDAQHASRLYLDGGYALVPKAGWMFYVTFDIESNVLKDIIFQGRKKTEEVGMLVKQADLPKFQINTEVLNQYNRKTVIQKNITYQPVSFVFHDDISNLVNDMWINYYRYYYNDGKLTGNTALGGIANQALNGLLGANVGGFASQLLGTAQDPAKGPYGNTKYQAQNSLYSSTDYGLNTPKVKKPFFRSITLYQLNRHQFVSYQLINPMIRSWEHDRLDQTQGGRLLESKMQLDYETVFYSYGSVGIDNPAGFATLHYDNTPSPLGVGSSGFESIFGNALAGTADIFGDVLGNIVPEGGSRLLDAINAVGAVGVGGLTGIVAGNFAGQSRTNTGYSTLNYTGNTPQTSLNGLGVDLNLNLGNNSATAGQVAASAISIAPVTPVATQGVAPLTINATPAIAANGELQTLANINSAINNAQFVQPSENNNTQGTTPAAGQYFAMPLPLASTTPFTAQSINQNSSISDISSAITSLNTAWANDNDFVASQTLNPADVTAKLNSASSISEFNSIQSAASASVSATTNLQITVNSKYQAESIRLSNLLYDKQNNVTGSSSIQ